MGLQPRLWPCRNSEVFQGARAPPSCVSLLGSLAAQKLPGWHLGKTLWEGSPQARSCYIWAENKFTMKTGCQVTQAPTWLWEG